MNKSDNNHYRIIKEFTDLMENRFSILGFKFGIEPIIGLIPGLGDIISMILSIYIVVVAASMNLRDEVLALMIGNIILDFLVGIIPGVGDIADFAFKANTRNLKLLEKELQKEQR